MTRPILHKNYQGLEQLATATIVFDKSLKIIYLNPSAEVLLELSHGQAHNQNIEIFFEDREFFKSALNSAAKKQSSYRENEYFIKEDLLNSTDIKKLIKYSSELKDIYFYKAFLKIGEKELEVFGPSDLYDLIYNFTRKQYTIQRYKGLGEMNPDQLWDTTLDPDARTLLKVQYKDEWAADELFGKLMGGNVEPRRNFIQKYALEAENIDT